MARILIVEDNLDLLQMMEELLEPEHDVVTATSGEGALENADEAEFDLVLLDIQLPGMDGVETGRALKRAQNSVPILVITALAQADDAQQIVDSGCCDDYMTKPATMAEIQQRVDHLLAAGTAE